MADKVTLNVEVRKEIGSKHSVALRSNGKTPGVVYGHGQDPVPVTVSTHDFVELLHHGHRIFNASVGDKKETLLVKDLQYDHLGKSVIHADLIRVDMKETVKVTVPIELKGTAAGTHEGGMVDQHLDELEVECMVSAIPETISVPVKDLNVGDSIQAGDVELADGMKLITSADTMIVNCHIVSAAKTTEELEEDMPTAPEVIGEKKEDDEEQQNSE